RQTDELQKQMAVLKTQQEQMLKMQQMASQARSMQNSAPVLSAAPSAVNTAMSAASGMPVLQQSQQGSLASRLPPPLVPTSVSKPQISQQQQQPQQQQQQQLFGSANPLSPVGAFAAAQGISNIPAASSSTTRLTPMANGGVFSNHALAGSTPNLGSLNKPMLGASNFANAQSAAQNISNFGSLNQSSTQLMPQQRQQLMAPQQQFVPQQQQLMQPQQLPMGNMSLVNQNQNQGQSRYDLFKSINPQAPGIFTGQQPQQSVMANPQFSAASAMAPTLAANGLMQPSAQHSTGPTGIFAMPNPTVSQPSAMFGNGTAGFQQHIQPQQLQQQQQQQPQQQQMFSTGQAGAFGGQQMQWR
ncbi:hypothetical protein H4R20_005507, partial [Coemansia guatemalensis]